MKNRNKRITSVLAASMALGTFAPVIASVAPVFAAAPSQVPAGFKSKEYNDVNGNSWWVKPNEAGNALQAYLYGVGDQDSVNLTINSTVTVVINDEKYEATVKGIGPKSGKGISGIKNLETLNVNADGVNIRDNAFQNANNLQTVVLDGVDNIGAAAFNNCNNLSSVTLNDGLKTIGNFAFASTDLTTINIPNSVETIGTSAFQNTELTGEIALPTNLETVGENAFATNASSLTLDFPQENDENSKHVTSWGATNVSVFGAVNWQKGINYFNIKGTEDSVPSVLNNSRDTALYVAAPNITLTVGNTTLGQNKGSTVVLGQNVKITVSGKGTLTIDGVNVTPTYTTNNGQTTGTYTLTTPQLGEHSIVFTNTLGAARTVKINVVANKNNYWTDANFTVPEWHLGADVNPSGAVAKYGTVEYVYSATPNGVFSSAKPTSEGTWWVKAVVTGTDTYNGLESDAKSFTVLAPLAKQGWENTAAGWTYYVDGEQVKSELITVDGRKYLIGDNGIMVKGWAKNDLTDNEWMFFDNYGCQKTGWLSNNGKWYFFNEDGVMQANEWVTDKGKSYFLTQSGGMATSRWLKKDGHDVYVDNSGALKTGWLFDSNYMAWYYLEPDTGYMATSGTVDGWTIQANGQAVQK